VIIDLDHFKEVNDVHGHQEGDRVLRDVSRRWTEALRGSDVLARAGGDEFVLLLPSTDQVQASDMLGRLAGTTDQAFSAGLSWPRASVRSRTSSGWPTPPVTRPKKMEVAACGGRGGTTAAGGPPADGVAPYRRSATDTDTDTDTDTGAVTDAAAV